MWLVVALEDRRLDMKALAGVIGAARLSFARPARLGADLGIAPGAVTPFALINHRGRADHGVRGHLLQVLDPAEETLPFSGRVRFDGMEGEGDVLIGRVEAMRDEYRSELAHHNDGLQALANSVGWSYAIHHTDSSPEAALLALYLVLSQTIGD